jgi:hypothetical protein
MDRQRCLLINRPVRDCWLFRMRVLSELYELYFK